MSIFNLLKQLNLLVHLVKFTYLKISPERCCTNGVDVLPWLLNPINIKFDDHLIVRTLVINDISRNQYTARTFFFFQYQI